MKNAIIILALILVIFIAGCNRGITGQAVRDVDNQQTTSTRPTTTIFFQYEENKKSCENGVWRKQTLANGTVQEYCNLRIKELNKCDADGACGKYEECFNGYCRPI